MGQLLRQEYIGCEDETLFIVLSRLRRLRNGNILAQDENNISP